MGLLTAMLVGLPRMMHPQAPGIAEQRNGSYTFFVGRMRVTALSDGSVPQDLHALLHGAPIGDIDDALRNDNLSNPIELSINAFLVQTGGRKLLVDTGVGQLFGPKLGGKMLANLRSEGVGPEQITDVLLTHLHDDHMGGIVRDGHTVFPNAIIHVGKPDLTYFFDRSNSARDHYAIKYFDEASLCITPYLKSGKVEAFNGRTQILPGVTATLHPGHTPGSAFYELDSDGQRLVFVGDLVHIAAVQFPHPGITIDYDVSQPKAAHRRETEFIELAQARTLIAVPHLPFPGVGHVRQTAGGFEWMPVEQTDRAAVLSPTNKSQH